MIEDKYVSIMVIYTPLIEYGLPGLIADIQY